MKYHLYEHLLYEHLLYEHLRYKWKSERPERRCTWTLQISTKSFPEIRM